MIIRALFLGPLLMAASIAPPPQSSAFVSGVWIGEAKIACHHADDVVELVCTLFKKRAGAEHRAMTLHGPLHRKPDAACSALAL